MVLLTIVFLANTRGLCSPPGFTNPMWKEENWLGQQVQESWHRHMEVPSARGHQADMATESSWVFSPLQ